MSLAAQRAQATQRTQMLAAIGSLAAAAVLAIVVIPVLGTREALPLYSLAVSHGTQAVRSANASKPEIPRFAPHSRLRIDLRPAKAFREDIKAKVWAEQRERLEPVPLTVKTSKDGAVRLEGVVGVDFSLAPGEHTLWVFVFQQGEYDDAQAVRPAIERRRLPAGEGALLSTKVVIDAENQAPVPAPSSL